MKKIILVVMVVSWSCYYVLSDELIKSIGSPYIEGLGLRILTFVFMTLFFLVKKEDLYHFQSVKGFVEIICVAGAVFLFDCLINIGLVFSSASIGTALLKTEILFVFALNAIIYKQQISIFDCFTAILMFVGALLIVIKDVGNITIDKWSFIFIASALINSVCAFRIKSVQQKYHIESNQIAYINNAVSLILYLITSLITSRPLQILDGFVDNVHQLTICSICQVTLMFSYYYSLKEMPIRLVKVVLLIVPILTLLIQLLLSHVTINTVQMLGMILTLIGSLSFIIFEKNKNEN